MDCCGFVLVPESPATKSITYLVGSNHPATTYTIVSGRKISQVAGSLRGIAASIFRATTAGAARSTIPLEAVDGEMLSGHEDVWIGSKICNESGPVLWYPDPAHADSRHDLRFAPLY